MQNVTVSEWCRSCVNFPIIWPTILPYILISLPANSRVLWLMKSSPIFWTDRMEVFGFHLVLTEILFGSLGAAFIIITINYYNTTGSHIVATVNDFILTARCQFQCSICIERYIAVVHPVLYLRYKPLRYRMSFCGVIWLESILFSVVQMFFCSDNPISVGLYAIHFSCIFMVNSFCCLAILKALKHPSPGEGEREVSNTIKKRAFNIVFIFLLTTFIGYVPLIMLFFLSWDIDPDILCVTVSMVYYLMVWLGIVHPVLYLCRAGKTPGNK